MCQTLQQTVYNVIAFFLYKQLYERYYYHPQFTDEKTEASLWSSNSTKVTWLRRDSTTTCTQRLGVKPLCHATLPYMEFNICISGILVDVVSKKQTVKKKH